MAIKKMNADMLDKVLSNASTSTEKTQDKTTVMDQDTLERLYEKGLEEIVDLMIIISASLDAMALSSFAPLFMNSDVIDDYVNYMSFFCENMIPKLLKGDIDGIMNLTTEDTTITAEKLNEMREQIYTLLKEKNN